MRNMNRRITFIVTVLLLAMVPTASATFVEMEKTHTPIQTNYHSGDTIQFTVIVSVHTVNGGPILSIKDFSVRDTLPEGLTYVALSQTSAPAPVTFMDHGNGTLVWDFGAGPFMSDPHATITFEVTVDNDAPLGQTIINEAKALYTETVSQIRSSPAVTDGIRINEPGISMVKECQVSSSMAPADITYTYTVENTGDCDLFDVTVYDETLALTVLGPIDLAMGQEASDQHTIFDQPEGSYTNTATATGFDKEGHEVTASDSAECRISTMVGGEIIELWLSGSFYVAQGLAVLALGAVFSILMRNKGQL